MSLGETDWWKQLCIQAIRIVLKAPVHNTLVLGEVPVLCGVTIDATTYDLLDTESHRWVLFFPTSGISDHIHAGVVYCP
jgi:hypothetical protein